MGAVVLLNGESLPKNDVGTALRGFEGACFRLAIAAEQEQVLTSHRLHPKLRCLRLLGRVAGPYLFCKVENHGCCGSSRSRKSPALRPVVFVQVRVATPEDGNRDLPRALQLHVGALDVEGCVGARRWAHAINLPCCRDPEHMSRQLNQQKPVDQNKGAEAFLEAGR